MSKAPVNEKPTPVASLMPQQSLTPRKTDNDELGLDIMARGVLQDWLATMFNQYDQIAGKVLAAAEASSIKPKIVPPIGEPFSTKCGAKVNLTN